MTFRTLPLCSSGQLAMEGPDSVVLRVFDPRASRRVTIDLIASIGADCLVIS